MAKAKKAKKAKKVKKTSRKTAAKSARKVRPKKTAAKSTRKSLPKATSGGTAAAGKASPTAAPKAPPAGKQPAASGSRNIRVRMYRVGFGDFFLMTVPGKNGPAHILIDCGVHAKNINTIGGCVQDMAQLTSKRLALVILTHYHADHM